MHSLLMVQHLAANHKAGIAELAHVVPVVLAHVVRNFIEVNVDRAHGATQTLVYHPQRHYLILDNQMHRLIVSVLQMFHQHLQTLDICAANSTLQRRNVQVNYMLRQDLARSHFKEIRLALFVVGEAMLFEFSQLCEFLEAVTARVPTVLFGVDRRGVGAVQNGSDVVQMPVHFCESRFRIRIRYLDPLLADIFTL